MFPTEQIVMSALAKKADMDYAEVSGNMFLLRMPKIYSILGVLGVSLFLPYIILPFTSTENAKFFAFMLIGMGVVAGIPGVMCLLYGLRHSITIAGDVFHVTGPFGKTRSLRWEQVVGGSFSSIEQAMVLRLEDGTKMRVSPYLKGAKLFWRMLKERGGRPVDDWGLPYEYWR